MATSLGTATSVMQPGYATITAAGTAENFPAAAHSRVWSIIIRPHSGNSNGFMFGASDVAMGSNEGITANEVFTIAPGHKFLPTEFWFDGTTSGDKFDFWYVF